MDENDYLNFPLWLLNLMKFLYVVGLGGGLAMFVLFLVGNTWAGLSHFVSLVQKMGFVILYTIYSAGPDAFEEVLNWIKPVVAFLFFTSIAVMFYLACLKMDKILDDLSRSEAVKLRSPIKGQCFHSRYEALGVAGFVLTFPSLAIRRGQLNADDYDNFPVGLRLLIKVSSCSLCSVFFYFIAVELIYEYLSWVDWLLMTLNNLGCWWAEIRGDFYEC
ncbi:hypothetical protein [Pseudomonas sp. S2_F03]